MKKKRTFKSKLMTRAWEIAWNAYFEFGRVGTPKEYFSDALKLAWGEVKEKEAKKMAKEKAKAENVAFLQSHTGEYEAILQMVKNMTHNGKITGGLVVTARAESGMYGNFNDVYHVAFGDTAEDVARLLSQLTCITSFELDFMTPEQEAERKAKNAVSRQNAKYNAEQIRQNVYDNF